MTVNQTVHAVMSKPRRSRPLRTALGLSAVALVAGTGVVFGVYKYNNLPPGITIPTPPMPADNGYDDFVRAGDLAKTMRYKSPLDMAGPAEETQTYANYKACAPEAALVEAAMRRGLDKPYQMPPLRSSKSVNFPAFAEFRDVARVLAGKARYEELSGHPDQSVDTLLDSLEMGVTMPRGGNLISGLVGIAVEAISIRPMEELLPRLTDAQLAHVAARLDVIAAKRVAYADIMEEEGNASTAMLQETLLDSQNQGLKGIDNVGHLFTGGGDGEEDKLTWRERLQAAKYMFANKRALLLRHQAYFKALVAEARQPYTNVSSVHASDDPLEQAVAGVFEHARDKFVGMEAATSLLQAEVALERYRFAKGRYPASLRDLSPVYLKTLPIDVCSGSARQPLHYTSLQGAYRLYSIGTDMKDDNGWPGKYIGVAPGDIVAQHLWPTKMQPVTVPGK